LKRRHILCLKIKNAGWIANRGSPRGDVRCHNGIGPNPRVITDRNASDDLRAGADIDMTTNSREP